MKSSRVLTVVFLVAMAGLLWWLSSDVSRVECRVCIEFEGRRNCATAAATTQEEAVHSARNTACGTISGGVRDSIQCGNTAPSEQTCTGA
jgi:hypothetical protein